MDDVMERAGRYGIAALRAKDWTRNEKGEYVWPPGKTLVVGTAEPLMRRISDAKSKAPTLVHHRRSAPRRLARRLGRGQLRLARRPPDDRRRRSRARYDGHPASAGGELGLRPHLSTPGDGRGLRRSARGRPAGARARRRRGRSGAGHRRRRRTHGDGGVHRGRHYGRVERGRPVRRPDPNPARLRRSEAPLLGVLRRPTARPRTRPTPARANPRFGWASR